VRIAIRNVKFLLGLQVTVRYTARSVLQSAKALIYQSKGLIISPKKNIPFAPAILISRAKIKATSTAVRKMYLRGRENNKLFGGLITKE